MLEKLRLALVITRRETRDQLRDWRIMVPLALLTLFFPVLMDVTAQQIVGFVIKQGGASILYERLIPFLLMVVGFFPITVSLVIALESFAGETERRSIEPLLDSPLEDWQLYVGKLLAGMAASIGASYLGTIVYLIGLKLTLNWLPPPVLLVQILILSAVQALVMVSGAVVVSTQTTSVRAANLLSSFIIIPMALLLQVESVIMFWGLYDILWWAILGQIVLAGMLVRTGLAHFNREELLGRELDAIDLGGSWRLFKKSFAGQARSFGYWYLQEVKLALGRLRLPIAFMALITLVGVWMGMDIAYKIPLTQGVYQWAKTAQDGMMLESFLKSNGLLMLMSVLFIWLNNLKSVLLLSFLAFFSFGVAGVIGLMVTLVVLGVLTGVAAQAGISPVLFATAYFLPHGLLEVPAIVITGAALLRLGTTLVTPAKGQTIGEAFIHALADWAKVILGVVIPLFFLAAWVEVLITPRFAIALLSIW